MLSVDIISLLIVYQLQKRVGGTNDTILYEYDANGKLRRATNSEGSTTVFYYEHGAPQQVSYPNGRSVYYGYNSDYQRSYTADNMGFNISYHYNGKKLLSEIRNATSNETIVSFEYDVHGKLSRKLLSNGAYTVYTYEEATQRLSSTMNYHSNDSLSSKFEYTYDTKGRTVGVETTAGNWTYKYDPGGQLIGWIDPSGNVEEYGYDGRSNRAFMSVNGQKFGYSTNNMNQYTSFNQTTFFYDDDGNLVRKNTTGYVEAYGFDAESKLTQSQAPGKT